VSQSMKNLAFFMKFLSFHYQLIISKNVKSPQDYPV